MGTQSSDGYGNGDKKPKSDGMGLEIEIINGDRDGESKSDPLPSLMTMVLSHTKTQCPHIWLLFNLFILLGVDGYVVWN